jgi:D-alanyl-D-alanine carboxypeptidase (penicillin-binding protein 5/6)
MTNKKLATSLFSSVLFLSAIAVAQAANPVTVPTPRANVALTSAPVLASIPQPQLTPTAPALTANGYILMDAASGQMIAAKNPDQRMAPASLTKMMTSYIISTALRQGRIHLDDPVPISKEAWQTGGSKMFVKVGAQVPVRDLMQGIIVDSGNDACVAMAEFVAGSQDSFVNLMNQQAAALGMAGTHFADVNGLPNPDHYTTPRDMATLARHLIYDFPEDYKWYSQKWFNYNGIKQPNRNRLLWRDASVDGIKTGHTDEAGFCLVASANRNGTRLISVVMGAPTDAARADDNESLLTYGFRFFETHKLYAADTALNNIRVYQGANSQMPVGLTNDLFVVIPVGQYQNLKANLVLNAPVKAPIKKGQQLGKVEVTLSDKTINTVPLVALQDDPLGSLWQRMSDRVGLLFHRS